MAADVSSLVRTLGGGGCKDDQHRAAVNDSTSEKPVALITRDLLGGSSRCVVESQDLDLDLPVPSGWEKRLDLESGKVYIQRSDTSTLPSMSEQKLQMNHEGTSTQVKLNSPLRAPLNLFDETSLDLKLVSSSMPSSNNYQSVCTLDKVKSALERAEKEPIKKRNPVWKPCSSSPSPSSYSSSSSSMRETQEEESEEKLMSSPMAAGCPGCLSYVLITKNNPKCPRCKSVVPFPLMKKPRIDLNISI
ncbi:uncharacterized protein LOC114712160 [Neltuma alba]|uniref:uncharacterized protein LOC114712160 n=2 Tax=Neltuma alba TaxID=207710 RepID=UPI0010A4B84F|nr:uncharacterized protein LOC114712160 [Prosopis alba]